MMQDVHRTLIAIGMLAAILVGQAGTTSAAPVIVKLEKNASGYELTRGGKPYFVKGAGGKDHWEDLVKAGGNSVRTWGSDNLDAQLDQAQKLGLTVTVGFWVGHENQGFNYHNAQAVADQ